MTKNYNDLGVEFKYLIVNDMDQKYGLWVNTVGFQSIQPNSPYPLKDHPTGYFFNAQKGRILREYQLVYITKGRGAFSSETASRPKSIGVPSIRVLRSFSASSSSGMTVEGRKRSLPLR